LKDRELLTALGALSGCEENIRNASIIIRVTHEYRQKLTQALGLFAGTKTPSEEPTSSPAAPNAPRTDAGANPKPQGGE
jgi:hypothetical protein